MYFTKREDALRHALRIAALTVEPEALIEAAQLRGDPIPGLEFSPSITGQGFLGRPGWGFDRDKSGELKALVESLRAEAPTSKTPTRKAKGDQNATR